MNEEIDGKKENRLMNNRWMGEETVERTDKWTAEYTIGLHEGKD
jgi:hypothetical protein